MLVAVAVLAALAGVRALTQGSVLLDPVSSQYSFLPGVADPAAVAFGSFDDALDSKGWGVLRVSTNSSYSNAQQMTAAGFLEGALSSSRIYEGFINIRETFFGKDKPVSDRAAEFLLKQDEWSRAQAAKHSDKEIWEHVGYLVNQLDGLVLGYNSVVEDQYKLTLVDFLMLQADGDIGSVLQLQNITAYDWKTMTKQEFKQVTQANSRCSGFIKITPDLKDFFIGHSTWYTYQSMNRIYKIYYLDLQTSSSTLLGKGSAFSSYPGVLASIDDYYVISNGIVMISTTNEVFNNDLVKKVVPESLFAWQRVRVSNMIGDSGSKWFSTFKSYNSGTYNNQYMVFDAKLFTPGENLKPDTLWIIEQIPTLVVGEDRTSDLAESLYWASYNIPFFKNVYDLSDYQVGVEMDPHSYIYNSSFRANIFRRDHSKVTDLTSMKAIMRYNDYKNDPLSLGRPDFSVCCRPDLLAENPYTGGCSDSKVTSLELLKTLSSVAVNGPTTDHDLPPFQWSTSPFKDLTHLGQPDVFNFDWVEIEGGIDVALVESQVQ